MKTQNISAVLTGRCKLFQRSGLKTTQENNDKESGGKGNIFRRCGKTLRKIFDATYQNNSARNIQILHCVGKKPKIISMYQINNHQNKSKCVCSKIKAYPMCWPKTLKSIRYIGSKRISYLVKKQKKFSLFRVKLSHE